MGTGSATIIESIPNHSVKTQLTYTEPMAMSQLAEVTLIPAEESTKVQWSVAGKNGFFVRMVGVFFNFEKMVGGELEKGLNKLKLAVEGSN